MSDETHTGNIVGLSNRLSQEFGCYLRNGKFRIGIAQKVLNLYLKYLWCHDRIPTPPHCPFDSRIIGLLPPSVRGSYVWLVDIEVYKTWVVEATKKAGPKSLSEWELAEFEKTRL